MDDVLLCSTPLATASLLDARTGATLQTLKDCRPTARGLCSTSGFVLTVERARSFVHIWSWRKEQPRFRCQAPEKLTCVACTSDGAHAVAGGMSGKLYLWQVASGRLLLAWDAHFKPVTVLDFALADGFLLSAGEDAILLAWNMANLLNAARTRQDGLTPFRTWSEHMLPIGALCVAPCGQHDLIASASADQTVRVWRLSDSARTCVHHATFPTALTAVGAHPGHTSLYAGGADGRIYPMPLLAETAAAVTARAGSARTSTAHTGAVRALCVSLDGARLFSCGSEPGLRVWDTATLALLSVLQPSMTIETMIVLRSRPDELTSAGGGGGTLDEAAAGAAGASGASGAGGLTYGSTGSLLAPFKKFAEAAGEADATEATPRHMGCVPCALPLDASATTWLAPTADDELPLLATLPAGWRVETGALVSAGLGDGGRMAAAEATIRQLRGQLAQLQEVNRELYAIAADATIGMA